MESVHIKGAFRGVELTRYQELQTRETKPAKYFRFHKIISFFLSNVEKFDECKDYFSVPIKSAENIRIWPNTACSMAILKTDV